MFESKIEELNIHTQSLQTADQLGKRTYTVSEIQDILGVGKNAAYAAVRSGEFRVVRVGGSIRISKKSFDEWLDRRDGSLSEL